MLTPRTLHKSTNDGDSPCMLTCSHAKWRPRQDLVRVGRHHNIKAHRQKQPIDPEALPNNARVPTLRHRSSMTTN